MSYRSRREACAPIIARVLRETAGKSEKEIRAALRDAYPWGPRQYHPYQIWLDEIAKQRGVKVRPKIGGRPRFAPRLDPDERQDYLFQEPLNASR